METLRRAVQDMDVALGKLPPTLARRLGRWAARLNCEQLSFVRDALEQSRVEERLSRGTRSSSPGPCMSITLYPLPGHAPHPTRGACLGQLELHAAALDRQDRARRPHREVGHHQAHAGRIRGDANISRAPEPRR
jgi:hypothetical protein